MIDWLQHLEGVLGQGEAGILVIVARLEGSGPREAGARMLVSDVGTFGTIGGGELEWQAEKVAREMLAGGAAGRISRHALGPELGQCCGGRVTLAFEPFAPSDLAWVQRLANKANEPGGAGRSLRVGKAGEVVRSITETSGGVFSAVVSQNGLSIDEAIVASHQPLWLFGAGHVGRAVVRALAPLPFEVSWVDSRANAFADCDTHGTRTLTLAMPELGVEEAPEGTYFLVMTHSHPLDEEICAAVLARGNYGYLGLIGSASKRAQFTSRLGGRGFSAGIISQLHCPIGLDESVGGAGKDPAMIAASVAADLAYRIQVKINKSVGITEATR